MAGLFGTDAVQALAAGATEGARKAALPFWSDSEILSTSSYEDAIRHKQRQGQLTVFSTCVIDGKVFPGTSGIDDLGTCICIPQARTRYAIDRQKVQAETPAQRKARQAKKLPEPPPMHRIITEGYLPGPVSLKVGIWRREQWEAWLKYLPQINPKLKENQLRALSIDHPYLSALGIDQIFINDIGVPEESGTWGLHWIDIGAHEVFLPSKQGSNVAQVVKSKKLDINNNSSVAVQDQVKVDRERTLGPARPRK